jgi:hypothetical protein
MWVFPILVPENETLDRRHGIGELLSIQQPQRERSGIALAA